MVNCPICGKPVKERDINDHIDSGCVDHVIDADATENPNVASFFQPIAAKRTAASLANRNETPIRTATTTLPQNVPTPDFPSALATTAKRPIDIPATELTNGEISSPSAAKKAKLNILHKVAPLAERMRPRTLDEVCGQELVGPDGVIRSLIEQDRVPSMILWGGSGHGKTTIARLIASTSGCRFVEINSTSSGVNECKKIFAEARSELGLTGRKTIIFCDEIHRFSKSQQDVFLGPVEAGQITLIGATTENPSFKVVNALLSRCRTFTLSKLTDADVVNILKRALNIEKETGNPLLDSKMLEYLSAFADGDARTALNLLELAIDLSKRPGITEDQVKKSLTQTLVYDRAGDQHYDTISAFHKSIRGGDPNAALYYLARMLQSGEDPLYIARRLIVVASEDIGLADNSMLSLAVATHSAVERIGMPECRINLAHATVSMALSPKSTRAYRGLNAAMQALSEPGIAGLPVPIHLRNAPTRLMRELGYGAEYKYNPDYVDGKVKQEYLPERLRDKIFLEDRDLGTRMDPDLQLEEIGGDDNGDPDLLETKEAALADEWLPEST